MKNSKKRKSLKLGEKGEKIARLYLQNKGYKVLGRNYRAKFGEIDLIAKDLDDTLVFIEVKSLSGNLDSKRTLLPEDNLSAAKLGKLRKICQFFANNNRAMVGSSGWRIDLIAIIFSGTAEQGQIPRVISLKHYENI